MRKREASPQMGLRLTKYESTVLKEFALASNQKRSVIVHGLIRAEIPKMAAFIIEAGKTKTP